MLSQMTRLYIYKYICALLNYIQMEKSNIIILQYPWMSFEILEIC